MKAKLCMPWVNMVHIMDYSNSIPWLSCGLLAHSPSGLLNHAKLGVQLGIHGGNGMPSIPTTQ